MVAVSHPVTWGGPPPRSSSFLKGALVGASVLVGVASLITIIPGFNLVTAPVMSGISHMVERFKNNTEASDERAYRAAYYSPWIFRQLGINAAPGRKATISEFKEAAKLNTQIAKLYNAPGVKAANENRSSLLTNGGMAVAGAIIPGGGAVAKGAEAAQAVIEATKVVKITRAAIPIIGGLAGYGAGNALANALSHEVVDPQTLLEAMHEGIAQAHAQGKNPEISPQLVFLLRVSQDAIFAEEIKNNFGGGRYSFHQMEPEQQLQVMQAFPALANAAKSEAYAVSNSIMPVQELATSAPNLNSNAAQYTLGAQNATFAPKSFTERVNASRVASRATSVS